MWHEDESHGASRIIVISIHHSRFHYRFLVAEKVRCFFPPGVNFLCFLLIANFIFINS